jgi:transposase
MTKPYSLDLRERVTERVAAGDSVRAVATIFTVSVASVVRWSQRLRRTGSAAGGKMGGHRACTLIGERGWLMERIAAEPEVTVRGLMTELAERGVAVSYGTVWNFIHREGMSFKKKRAAGRARSPRRGAPPRAGKNIRRKNIRRGLILPVSSSSMKPGSRPTWLPSEVGARGAGGSRQRSRTVTGRQ